MGTCKRDGRASLDELARHPWAFRCDRPGCYYTVAAISEAMADYERWTHRCPRNGDPMTGKSILERAWEQLDEEVDNIVALMTHPLSVEPDQAVVVAQARARGKAEILALLMHPIFADADAISAEAGLRHQARQQGLTRVTPGLNPATAAADLKHALGEAS